MEFANILCGTKGVGKTNYSTQKWPDYLLLECDIPILGNTYSLIEYIVYKECGQHHISKESLFPAFFDILTYKKGMIIDNAELIDINTLKLLVNVAKQKNKKLVFIFDLPHRKLHTSNVFFTLLEWDMINSDGNIDDFKVDLEIIRNFVFNRYPNMQTGEFEKLIKITGYNFNEIKKLMWINKTKGISESNLTDKAINIYLKKCLEDELANVSPELVDTLKKSSIIGEIFDKYPLEHKNGFNILGALNHLEELEKLEIFISKCFSKNDCFKFVNCDIYNTILSSISSLQKNDWHDILKKYYMKIFAFSNDPYIKLEALIGAKRSAIEIGDYQAIFEINQALLFQYINSNDLLKAITIIDEIISNVYVHKDKSYIDYLFSVKIKILIDFGECKKALEIVKVLIEDINYTGSQEYLKYYYIKCLFDCGDTDRAYNEAAELVKKIKNASKTGNINQKIYPLVYSMMAYVQNHLGLEDNGVRYYRLALNYANNLIDDETLYYDILSKCDMFLSGDLAFSQLSRCVNFFIKSDNKLKLGKVYVNLATEMMFEDDSDKHQVEMYLISAKKAFIIPDENLAYAKNNLAIYYILIKNDYFSAIDELESALFVNLSDFTYMTIFLNLVMCYFVVESRNGERFKYAYKQFIKFEKLIQSRKNATKYESMYRAICDLIVLEMSNNHIKKTCDKYLSTMEGTDFFYPIFENIKNRACNIPTKNTYQSNCNFYRMINEKGIFLADFRFWE